MQMSSVVIAAYIPKTAEVKHLPSGTPVAHVRVGESVRYGDGSGETRELTNWHSLSFYGALAEVAQALKKGDNIYVDGRIEQRQFIARDCSKEKMEAPSAGPPSDMYLSRIAPVMMWAPVAGVKKILPPGKFWPKPSPAG